MATDSNDVPSPTISKLFCAPDADISFVSSDNILYKLHSVHLKTSSDVLGASKYARSDATQLPERARILQTLFQFIEPPPEERKHRQPSVLGMEEVMFFSLAEAAEKYVIYGAMNTCLTRMPTLISSHPFQVLNHCAKYKYWDMADDAAQKCLDEPNTLNEAVLKLTAPDVLPQWLLYYNAWHKAGREASDIFSKYLDKNSRCHMWPHFYAAYIRQLETHPRMITSVRSDPKNKVPCSIANCTCRSLDSKNESFGPPRWIHEIEMLEKGVRKFGNF
ncbi:hypothetical protein BDN70DRAFT_321138 [Pholiota conissans]|uniref:BTB domain-containing protein n=1 Tax=Pholiota conissans TaxID=109636 RepID=A0A9P5YSM5_9AGAR|nr:hypothetical protein BDN70DRAFT_321138 [Pholiota conissans]